MYFSSPGRFVCGINEKLSTGCSQGSVLSKYRICKKIEKYLPSIYKFIYRHDPCNLNFEIEEVTALYRNERSFVGSIVSITHVKTMNYGFFPRIHYGYPQVVHNRERRSQNTASPIVNNNRILINENFYL